jgi:plastocyanin
MPIQIITSLIVLIFTIYIGVLTYENRRRITCMTGMMIAMTNAMMSSTVLGLQLGYFFIPDLAVPTMLAIIVGMVAGYFTGKPVSLMSGLDGLMAGIMGGMMGAMVGVMIQPAQKSMFTIFMLIIYLITMLLLVKMMKEEVLDDVPVKKQVVQKTTTNKNSVFTFITIAIGFVAIISVLMAGKMMYGGNSSANSNIEPKVEMINGEQVTTIQVNGYGYGPETVEVQAGVPTKIKFVVDSTAGCARQVVSDDLGFAELLMNNEEKIIDIGTLQPGTYQYRCGMGMYWGTIVVK